MKEFVRTGTSLDELHIYLSSEKEKMTNPNNWSEIVWAIEQARYDWYNDENLQWDCLGNHIVKQLKLAGYEILPINTKMELDYDQMRERDRMAYDQSSGS